MWLNGRLIGHQVSILFESLLSRLSLGFEVPRKPRYPTGNLAVLFQINVTYLNEDILSRDLGYHVHCGRF